MKGSLPPMSNSYTNICCPNCKSKFVFKKLSKRSSLAKCFCDIYPIIDNILYLQTNKLQKEAVACLLNGNEKRAMAVLLNLRNRLYIPLLIFILPSLFNKVVHFFTHKYTFEIIGFKNTLRILVCFTFSKSWANYLSRREQSPSYFMSLAAIEMINDPNSFVADLGCGVGQLLMPLATRVRSENIVGIDNSYLDLLLARYFFAPVKSILICSDIERKLPLNDNKVDAIFATDSFHYVRHKSKLLLEFNRVISKHGFICLLQVITNKIASDGYMRITSLSLLRKLILSAGFPIIRISSSIATWKSFYKSIINYSKIITSGNSYNIIFSKKMLSNKLDLSDDIKSKLEKIEVDYSGAQELKTELMLQSIFNKFNKFIFFSPHYDDAVLSCGFLIDLLKKAKKDVVIVTIFTRGSGYPYTNQAIDFLARSGGFNPYKLFNMRSIENKKALGYLKVKWLDLDFIDAAFRKSKLLTYFSKISHLIPFAWYFYHIYPTPSKQFFGSFDWQDKKLYFKLKEHFCELIPSSSADKVLLLAPLGIGGHADHVIVRDAVAALNHQVYYWEDFPYNTNPYLIKGLLSKLTKFSFSFQLNVTAGSKKYNALHLYKSQMPVLFPNGKIPKNPEKYYSI